MRCRSLLPYLSLFVLASACGKSAAPGFSRASAEALTPPDSFLFSQQVDHDAGKDSAVFSQRYFRDSTFAADPDAPVFLFICGEGPCSVDQMEMATAVHAQKYHGHMLALEHRYYGKSFPVSDLRVENLKYLTIAQTLEDLATFVRAMQADGLTGKLITIGGSYGGTLSAYFRLKHPELSAGALASSAPVRAKEDFEEYDLHIAKVLGPDCGAAQRALVTQVDAILDAEMTDPVAYGKLMTAFGMESATSPDDFANDLAYPLGGLAQYGSPTRTEYCDLVQSAAPLAAVGAYSQVMRELEDQGSGESSGNHDVAGIQTKSATSAAVLMAMPRPEMDESETDLPEEDTVGGRSWLYQMCTEFGFLPTAAKDRAVSVYSKRLTLESARQYCQMFGTLTVIDTAKTNAAFYGPLLHGDASHIFYTNGSNDPWSELSFTGPVEGREVYSYVIAGGHHCDDLNPEISQQSASLQQAKAQFDELLGRWLGR